MRYLMRQKVFALGDDFVIKDDQGRERFVVDTKVFSLGDSLTFQDTGGRTLLTFDDTTFGQRLTKGEVVMVEAWDGWCPTSEPNIKFVIPSEGSDLWADTMVVLKTSKNKEAAHALINYILDPEVHGWVASNILYKVPNKAAMDKVDPALIKANSPLGMSPADLLQGESIIDLGPDSAKYTRLSTEVQAAQ